MLYLSTRTIVIIAVNLARISQAIVDGCILQIKVPLGIIGYPPGDFTRNFTTDDIVKFHCIQVPKDNITYKLEGAPKVKCQSNSKWSSKTPRCKATLCSTIPPTVPNARLVTTVIQGETNQIGKTVSYKCEEGYIHVSHYLTKVCQKDGYWQGNTTCRRITCSLPVLRNGNVTYKALVYGSTAGYRCNAGYVLTGPSTTKCGDNGKWLGNIVPQCLKLCSELIPPKNGYYLPARPFFRPGSTITFICYSSRYIVSGSPSRTCQNDGQWSGSLTKCVVNRCGPPGRFDHGRLTSTHDPYIIGTIVKFECSSGYKLTGSSTTRICQHDGTWTGVKNPSCIKVFCRDPGNIMNGDHNPFNSYDEYPYGTSVKYTCHSQYYLWGNSTLVCSSYQLKPYWSSDTPQCLSLTQYSTECHKANGHFHIQHGHPHCVQQGSPSITCTWTDPGFCQGFENRDLHLPTASSSESKSNRQLDTLTIVTASAGSTLGALVILLSIMLFVRRFHRNRRYRNHNIRSRFYSDDDHVTLISCPRGFHFPLPSYDEAMSQVQRDPPPFESVVEANGTTVINNNFNNTLPMDENTSNRETPNSSSDSGAHDRTVLQVSDDQQINIVSNPMTENSQTSEYECNPRNSMSSQDSLAISEPPSSHDGTALSLSEDDESINESQPLI